MQSLEVISVNIWQILISLCNLLILFLGVKRFLFKPVMNMLAKRNQAIDKQYADAEEANRAAEADKEAYRQKMEQAQAEADGILQEAQKTARVRSDAMLSDAKEKADDFYQKAHAGIEAEKRRAEQELRRDVAALSLELAEKMLQREVKEEDHRELIDSFLGEIGGSDGTDQ